MKRLGKLRRVDELKRVMRRRLFMRFVLFLPVWVVVGLAGWVDSVREVFVRFKTWLLSY